MSADTVVGAITTEAAQEVADLLAEARRAAEAQLAAAREAVDAQVASACAVAEREARVEALRAVNAATLRLVRRRAELDDEQVDRVIATAERRLEAIAGGGSPRRWADALARLSQEALALAGPEARVEVRAADAGSLQRALAGADAHIVSLSGNDVPAGVRVRSADGRVEIDALLATRLRRVRDALAGDLAALLEPER